MSSTYYVLCLNHNPATTIAGPFDGPEVPLRLIADRAGTPLADEHDRCDLLISKYSGGLIELCCPGSNANPAVTHGHVHPRWIDADLVRLLLALQRESISDETRRLATTASACWFPRRLVRLCRDLGFDVPAGT